MEQGVLRPEGSSGVLQPLWSAVRGTWPVRVPGRTAREVPGQLRLLSSGRVARRDPHRVSTKSIDTLSTPGKSRLTHWKHWSGVNGVEVSIIRTPALRETYIFAGMR